MRLLSFIVTLILGCQCQSNNQYETDLSQNCELRLFDSYSSSGRMSFFFELASESCLDQIGLSEIEKFMCTVYDSSYSKHEPLSISIYLKDESTCKYNRESGISDANNYFQSKLLIVYNFSNTGKVTKWIKGEIAIHENDCPE